MKKMLSQELYLLTQLAQRDLAHRYKGTFGGLLWVVAQPLLMLAVYTLVFGLIFKPRWTGLNSVWDYALVIFLGKIPYIFLLETVGRAPGIISGHASYVKKLAFPLHLLPWMSHLTATAIAAISLAVWVIFDLVIHGTISVEILMVPVLYLPMFISLLGISFLVSSLGTYFKDVGQIVQPVLFAAMFLSPVFYPLSMTPSIMRKLILINPITLPIEQTRDVLLFGNSVQWSYWWISLVVSGLVLILGYLWFQRTREGFAEVL